MRTNALRWGRAKARPLPWMDRLTECAAVMLLAFGLVGCSLLQPGGGPGDGVETADETPATTEEVAEIQRLLADRGYDTGPVDGVMGPRTAAAIRQYQEEADIQPTGRATRGLLARLRDTATGPGRRPPKPPSGDKGGTVQAVIGEPTYVVGDTYVFSHGISYTVLRVGADRVTWRDSRGDYFTTPRAPALPQIEWESGAWKGRNETRRDGGDWPPDKGQVATFDVRSEEWNMEAGPGAARTTTDARWSCRNEGPDKLSVPAGKFDGVVVACERSPAPAGLWQRRVWHFVPDVAHFVRRTDRDGSGLEIESIELVAAIPGTESWPPAARAGLKMAVESALSKGEIGSETPWSSTAVRDKFTIHVTAESKTPVGELCRTYVIRRTAGAIRQVYPAIACRRPGGEWKTPGFDGGVVGVIPRVGSAG